MAAFPPPTSPGGRPSHAHVTLMRADSLLDKLSQQDMLFVETVLDQKVDIVPPDARNRAARMYAVLDRDQNGQLNDFDFSSTDPETHMKLQSIWAHLLETFDFDHNCCVDQKEFLGFFVVTALVKGQTFPIDNPTLLGSLCQWLEQFNENLFAVIGEYESALFRGTLPELTSTTDMETS